MLELLYESVIEENNPYVVIIDSISAGTNFTRTEIAIVNILQTQSSIIPCTRTVARENVHTINALSYNIYFFEIFTFINGMVRIKAMDILTFFKT